MGRTSATVGAMLLSKLARLLELAAINHEIEKIILLNPVLMEEIDKHRMRVESLFVEEKEEIEDYELIFSYLDMLDMSVSMDDYDTADFTMEEIKKYQYPDAIQKLMDVLVGQILNMESSQTEACLQVL